MIVPRTVVAQVLAGTGDSAKVAGIGRDILDAFEPLLRLALRSGRAVQIPVPNRTEGWAVQAKEEAMDGWVTIEFRVTAPDGEVVLTAAVGSGAVSWLIEALDPHLHQWPCAAAWLPAFPRCFAWCWLERRTAVRAANANVEWCGGIPEA